MLVRYRTVVPGEARSACVVQRGHGDRSPRAPARPSHGARPGNPLGGGAMSIETLVNDYKAKTARSRQMYEEALQVMPGGNSRTTTFFDPYPFYIMRGTGARIWDADGTERL